MSKTILITGASSGFGRDTAETLCHAGHCVYASMREVQGKNREAAEALRKLGVKTVERHVSDDTSAKAASRQCWPRPADRCARQQRRDRLGRGNRSLHNGTGEGDLRHECHRAASRHPRRAPLHARQHDGLIINIGSILGRVTFPFVGIYGASKFAVEALTDSLRYEVSQLGVEVVEVQPSGYPTNFFTNIQTPAGIEVTESYGEVGTSPTPWSRP